MIEPKAAGNAVQQTTSTKISQTWLASQTGPIEWCACSRIALPRAAAAEQRARSRAEVRPAEHRVGGQPDEDQDSGSSASHRRAVAGQRAPRRVERRAREPAQQPDDRDRERRVDERQRRVADRDAGRAGHGVRRAHDA